MGNRCGRNSGAPGVELARPRLRSAEDAVAAIRMSAGGDDQESIVVLVCDDENRILLAVDFADAPTTGVCDVTELVLSAVDEGAVLVVGLIRPHDPGVFTNAEVEAIEELAALCLLSEVCLRDVIVVTGNGWRSAAEVVTDGFGDDNDHQ
jgi:hypothetical protein